MNKKFIDPVLGNSTRSKKKSRQKDYNDCYNFGQSPFESNDKCRDCKDHSACVDHTSENRKYNLAVKNKNKANRIYHLRRRGYPLGEVVAHVEEEDGFYDY